MTNMDDTFAKVKFFTKESFDAAKGQMGEAKDWADSKARENNVDPKVAIAIGVAAVSAVAVGVAQVVKSTAKKASEELKDEAAKKATREANEAQARAGACCAEGCCNS